MATLERALQIAVQAHAGQQDKSGAAYIFHPIRVMMRCTHPKAKIAALLHDVVEDTPVTMEELIAEGFDADVIAALRLLTHADGSAYDAYIDRLLSNPLAIEVKLADLADNSDLTRLASVDDKAIARLRRYHSAHRKLVAAQQGLAAVAG